MLVIHYFPKYFQVLLLLGIILVGNSTAPNRKVTCYSCNATTDANCPQGNPVATESCKIVNYEPLEGCMTIRITKVTSDNSTELLVLNTLKDCFNLIIAGCFYDEAKFVMSTGKCYKRLVDDSEYSGFRMCVEDKYGDHRPVDGYRTLPSSRTNEGIVIAACACNDRDLCNEHQGKNMDPEMAEWAPKIKPEVITGTGNGLQGGTLRLVAFLIIMNFIVIDC